jgi:hypothetical protein
MPITRIVSGGQTGADRGGLDAAIYAGVPHGGWCPKGRKAEDGSIPAKYVLKEIKSADYLKRTEANVIDSDATLLITFGRLSGGSLRTLEFCRKHGRPYHHVNLAVTSVHRPHRRDEALRVQDHRQRQNHLQRSQRLSQRLRHRAGPRELRAVSVQVDGRGAGVWGEAE